MAAGLSVAALAERLDRPETMVREWDAGRSLVPIAKVMPLCAALGISITDLVAID